MDYNKNYYQDLGLDKNCSQDDIKKAYRKLAHQYHPDKNKTGNDDKFKEISAAYAVISDSKQKQEYDQRSPHGNSYTPFNAFNGGGFEFHFGNGSPNDIFSQFFGQNSPFSNHFGFQREEFIENLDVNLSAKINLKQIYLNENLAIKFKRYLHCEDCKGTGFDKESKSDQCEMCDGTGRNYGKVCEYCRGDGKIYTEQCKKCNGEKITLKDTEVTLQNLFQIRDSLRNAHRGYGHQSKYYREKIGSLILNITVDRNDEFKIVNNYDLSKTIDIHYQDAIDGIEIIYTHIDNNIIKIKLPGKSKNNDIIRIKEKGLLKNENLRGDLYLKINIIIDYERV
jgi:molecular chaperone DnaJ